MNKCEANYTALTPITFLKRAAMFYGERNSIIYGQARFTWRQTYDRCLKLASSLQFFLGVTKDDVVSVLAPNIPAMYEMHFGVPMAGAILNTINIRLDAKTVKTILQHSQAKILFVDYDHISLAYEALGLFDSEVTSLKKPIIVIINEIGFPTYRHGKILTDTSISMKHVSGLEYEELISMGKQDFIPFKIDDEWDSIALNYTSGTTSDPKGVVYSHRGAYLSTLSMIIAWEMGAHPIYLWSLPMFHANGWTFAWGIAARGGTNVCIRNTNAPLIYESIALHGVTHMCCAPIVLDMLRAFKPKIQTPRSYRVQIFTGGAPPSAKLLRDMEEVGFDVTHTYGLTETTGSPLVCEWQKEWGHLSQEEIARLKSRQGISLLNIEDVDVKDILISQSVPKDGKSMGEIVVRGSSIMKGYLNNDKATSKAFDGGWFHTGDIGVVHSDGYIEIKDRLKDVIISGGENISSVEVERAIVKHPKVAAVAVVGMPHPKWGESPCAFVVKSTSDQSVTEKEILVHCKNNLSGYMVPKKVCFIEELPTNSTGKILKGKLREIAKKFEVSNANNDLQEKNKMVSRM